MAPTTWSRVSWWPQAAVPSSAPTRAPSRDSPARTPSLRFRGGLVFKAHRLVYHSTLGLSVIKKKKRTSARHEQIELGPRTPCSPPRTLALATLAARGVSVLDLSDVGERKGEGTHQCQARASRAWPRATSRNRAGFSASASSCSSLLSSCLYIHPRSPALGDILGFCFV